MSRYVLVNTKTNVVENIIEWDGGPEWSPPSGFIAINVDNVNVHIGYTYVNDAFEAPALPAPAPAPAAPTPEELSAQLTILQAQIAAITPKS